MLAQGSQSRFVSQLRDGRDFDSSYAYFFRNVAVGIYFDLHARRYRSHRLRNDGSFRCARGSSLEEFIFNDRCERPGGLVKTPVDVFTPNSQTTLFTESAT